MLEPSAFQKKEVDVVCGFRGGLGALPLGVRVTWRREGAKGQCVAAALLSSVCLGLDTALLLCRARRRRVERAAKTNNID